MATPHQTAHIPKGKEGEALFSSTPNPNSSSNSNSNPNSSSSSSSTTNYINPNGRFGDRDIRSIFYFNNPLPETLRLQAIGGLVNFASATGGNVQVSGMSGFLGTLGTPESNQIRNLLANKSTEVVARLLDVSSRSEELPGYQHPRILVVVRGTTSALNHHDFKTSFSIAKVNAAVERLNQTLECLNQTPRAASTALTASTDNSMISSSSSDFAGLATGGLSAIAVAKTVGSTITRFFSDGLSRVKSTLQSLFHSKPSPDASQALLTASPPAAGLSLSGMAKALGSLITSVAKAFFPGNPQVETASEPLCWNSDGLNRKVLRSQGSKRTKRELESALKAQNRIHSGFGRAIRSKEQQDERRKEFSTIGSSTCSSTSTTSLPSSQPSNLSKSKVVAEVYRRLKAQDRPWTARDFLSTHFQVRSGASQDLEDDLECEAVSQESEATGQDSVEIHPNSVGSCQVQEERDSGQDQEHTGGRDEGRVGMIVKETKQALVRGFKVLTNLVSSQSCKSVLPRFLQLSMGDDQTSADETSEKSSMEMINGSILKSHSIEQVDSEAPPGQISTEPSDSTHSEPQKPNLEKVAASQAPAIDVVPSLRCRMITETFRYLGLDKASSLLKKKAAVKKSKVVRILERIQGKISKASTSPPAPAASDEKDSLIDHTSSTSAAPSSTSSVLDIDSNELPASARSSEETTVEDHQEEDVGIQEEKVLVGGGTKSIQLEPSLGSVDAASESLGLSSGNPTISSQNASPSSKSTSSPSSAATPSNTTTETEPKKNRYERKRQERLSKMEKRQQERLSQNEKRQLQRLLQQLAGLQKTVAESKATSVEQADYESLSSQREKVRSEDCLFESIENGISRTPAVDPHFDSHLNPSLVQCQKVLKRRGDLRAFACSRISTLTRYSGWVNVRSKLAKAGKVSIKTFNSDLASLRDHEVGVPVYLVPLFPFVLGIQLHLLLPNSSHTSFSPIGSSVGPVIDLKLELNADGSAHASFLDAFDSATDRVLTLPFEVLSETKTAALSSFSVSAIDPLSAFLFYSDEQQEEIDDDFGWRTRIGSSGPSGAGNDEDRQDPDGDSIMQIYTPASLNSTSENKGKGKGRDRDEDVESYDAASDAGDSAHSDSINMDGLGLSDEEADLERDVDNVPVFPSRIPVADDADVFEASVGSSLTTGIATGSEASADLFLNIAFSGVPIPEDYPQNSLPFIMAEEEEEADVPILEPESEPIEPPAVPEMEGVFDPSALGPASEHPWFRLLQDCCAFEEDGESLSFSEFLQLQGIWTRSNFVDWINLLNSKGEFKSIEEVRKALEDVKKIPLLKLKEDPNNYSVVAYIRFAAVLVSLLKSWIPKYIAHLEEHLKRPGNSNSIKQAQKLLSQLQGWRSNDLTTIWLLPYAGFTGSTGPSRMKQDLQTAISKVKQGKSHEISLIQFIQYEIYRSNHPEEGLKDAFGIDEIGTSTPNSPSAPQASSSSTPEISVQPLFQSVVDSRIGLSRAANMMENCNYWLLLFLKKIVLNSVIPKVDRSEDDFPVSTEELEEMKEWFAQIPSGKPKLQEGLSFLLFSTSPFRMGMAHQIKRLIPFFPIVGQMKIHSTTKLPLEDGRVGGLNESRLSKKESLEQLKNIMDKQEDDVEIHLMDRFERNIQWTELYEKRSEFEWYNLETGIWEKHDVLESLPSESTRSSFFSIIRFKRSNSKEVVFSQLPGPGDFSNLVHREKAEKQKLLKEFDIQASDKNANVDVLENQLSQDFKTTTHRSKELSSNLRSVQFYLRCFRLALRSGYDPLIKFVRGELLKVKEEYFDLNGSRIRFLVVDEGRLGRMQSSMRMSFPTYPLPYPLSITFKPDSALFHNFSTDIKAQLEAQLEKDPHGNGVKVYYEWTKSKLNPPTSGHMEPTTKTTIDLHWSSDPSLEGKKVLFRLPLHLIASIPTFEAALRVNGLVSQEELKQSQVNLCPASIDELEKNLDGFYFVNRFTSDHGLVHSGGAFASRKDPVLQAGGKPIPKELLARPTDPSRAGHQQFEFTGKETEGLVFATYRSGFVQLHRMRNTRKLSRPSSSSLSEAEVLTGDQVRLLLKDGAKVDTLPYLQVALLANLGSPFFQQILNRIPEVDRNFSDQPINPLFSEYWSSNAPRFYDDQGLAIVANTFEDVLIRAPGTIKPYADAFFWDAAASAGRGRSDPL